jgi:hypothetical protein
MSSGTGQGALLVPHTVRHQSIRRGHRLVADVPLAGVAVAETTIVGDLLVRWWSQWATAAVEERPRAACGRTPRAAAAAAEAGIRYPSRCSCETARRESFAGDSDNSHARRTAGLGANAPGQRHHRLNGGHRYHHRHRGWAATCDRRKSSLRCQRRRATVEYW